MKTGEVNANFYRYHSDLVSHPVISSECLFDICFTMDIMICYDDHRQFDDKRIKKIQEDRAFVFIYKRASD